MTNTQKLFLQNKYMNTLVAEIEHDIIRTYGQISHGNKLIKYCSLWPRSLNEFFLLHKFNVKILIYHRKNIVFLYW